MVTVFMMSTPSSTQTEEDPAMTEVLLLRAFEVAEGKDRKNVCSSRLRTVNALIGGHLHLALEGRLKSRKSVALDFFDDIMSAARLLRASSISSSRL